MKRLALVTAILCVLDTHGALAKSAPADVSFSVASGSTLTTMQYLGTTGNTGTVAAGGALDVTNGDVAIEVDDAATITNSGTINATGDRAIHDEADGLVTIVNNAGATISSTGDDAIQSKQVDGTVDIENYGTIVSGNATTSAGQGIDLDNVTTAGDGGVINNYSTGVIEAYDSSAIHTGANTVINNAGTIEAFNLTGDSVDTSDAINADNNSGLVLNNSATGVIIGTHHGIGGAQVDGSTAFTMTVTNAGLIEGLDGSGMNIDAGSTDGGQALEVVTVNNSGTIIGNGVTGDGDGIDVDGVANVTNTGTIVSKAAFEDVSDGVTIGGGTIVNSGLIEGLNNASGYGAHGITLAGLDKDADDNPIPTQGIYIDSEVDNTGTIRAVGGAGIAVTGAATDYSVTINNEAGGLIEGGTTAATAPTGSFAQAAIYTVDQDISIVNSGTIEADDGAVAVDFGDSVSSLTVTGGSAAIIGDIEGGEYGSSITFAPGSGNRFAYNGNISGDSTLTIGAGTTVLNGTVAVTTTVQSGGTLAGTGTIGGNTEVPPPPPPGPLLLEERIPTAAVTVDSGATLAPGNIDANGVQSAGTMTINGNLLLSSGSTYSVASSADGSTASEVVVDGKATLTGSTLSVAQASTLLVGKTYTVVDATEGVEGEFASVTGNKNYAFVTPDVTYTSNTADLTMERNSTSFASMADTGYGRAAANALDTMNSSSSIYQHVATLSAADAPAAFDQLAGQVHANTNAALQGMSTSNISVPMAHLQANLNAGQVAGPATAQLGSGTAADLPQSAAQPAWAQVFGDWGTLGNTDTGRVRQSDGGIFMGLDKEVANSGWRLGGALGYTQGTISSRDTDGSASVEGYTAEIYGGRAFDLGAGKLDVTAGSAYTWDDIRTSRNVTLPGDNQNLTSHYGASNAQIFGEVGYTMDLPQNSSVRPFLGLAWNDLRTRGYSESGGDAALNGQSSSNNVASTTLGMNFDHAFETGAMHGGLHAMLGWRHAYGDVDSSQTASFNQGGSSFTTEGAPIARDAAVASIGVDLAVSRRTTVGVSYGGQYGHDDTQQTAMVQARMRF